jgi:predicted transcriptional regulator of viral defense system
MKDKKSTLQEYLETLQSRGEYWFLRKNIMQILGLGENAFTKAAYRLIKKNKLVRIRGEFYLIVPPEYRSTASLPASWFIDALMKHLNQSYYVGLLTAAGIYGAAHQQAMVFQVITNKSTRPITAGHVRIEFFYKKNIDSHFYHPVKTASGAMNVSTPEMTAFDLMRYSNASGQIHNVATILSELAEQLNVDVLKCYLENDEVAIATAQRLFYLLDTLKLNLDLTTVEAILKSKRPISRPLVAGGNAATIEHNKRWQILVNEHLEPDDI